MAFWLLASSSPAQGASRCATKAPATRVPAHSKAEVSSRQRNATPVSIAKVSLVDSGAPAAGDVPRPARLSTSRGVHWSSKGKVKSAKSPQGEDLQLIFSSPWLKRFTSAASGEDSGPSLSPVPPGRVPGLNKKRRFQRDQSCVNGAGRVCRSPCLGFNLNFSADNIGKNP